MRKLHPATIIVAIIPALKEAVRAALPVILGSFASGRGAGGDWVAIAIGGLTGFFAIGTYWTTRFDIEPEHVVHRTGWIFRKDRRIPLDRIQNVNIRQNVLERLFNVATIDVETALGKGRDLKLSVLKLADAERFREELIGAAQVDPTVQSLPDEPLVRLTTHDLIIGAVTEVHLQQMIVLFFTFVGPGVAPLMKLAERFGGTASVAVYVGIVLLAIVGAWLWGVVSYLLKYGNFNVRLVDQIFRISYGLVNRAQLAIRPERIEYLQLTTTIFQRSLDRASFFAGTASTFGEAGVLAPIALFVKRHVAYRSASDVLPGLDIEWLKWRPFSSIFYRAAIIKWLVFLGIVAFVAALIGTLWAGIVVGALTVLGACRLSTLLLARPENSYAISDDALVVRMGYLHQNTFAMPIVRIENLQITQSWFWRRSGTVHVVAQAMKHRIHMPAMPETDVDELAAKWHAAILEQAALKKQLSSPSSVDVVSLDQAEWSAPASQDLDQPLQA